jgi:hypothetical protein
MQLKSWNQKKMNNKSSGKPTPSASGKTLVVASTRGNTVTTAMVDGKPVTIGLNAYIKP